MNAGLPSDKLIYSVIAYRTVTVFFAAHAAWLTFSVGEVGLLNSDSSLFIYFNLRRARLSSSSFISPCDRTISLPPLYLSNFVFGTTYYRQLIALVWPLFM